MAYAKPIALFVPDRPSREAALRALVAMGAPVNGSGQLKYQTSDGWHEIWGETIHYIWHDNRRSEPGFRNDTDVSIALSDRYCLVANSPTHFVAYCRRHGFRGVGVKVPS